MNNNIFFFFYNLANQSDFFDKLVVFFAETFPYIVMFLALVFLLIHHDVLTSPNPLMEFTKKWKEIVFVFLSSGFAWCLAKLLKIFLHTPRPFVEFGQVHSLITETGYAFPSGHATFFMALAGALFFSHKKVGSLFIFFAILIGVARIIAGVHFPVDILGGFILGFAIAFFVRNVYPNT